MVDPCLSSILTLNVRIRSVLSQRVVNVALSKWMLLPFSLGGMLALGAKESDDEKKYLQLGADIAHTCHESYNRTGMSVSPLFCWLCLKLAR